MKRFFLETIVFSLVLLTFLWMSGVFGFSLQNVSANAITLPFGHDLPGVEHLPAVGLKDGNTVGKGAAAFTEITNIIGSFLSIVMGAVAIFALFVAGYHLVTAQSAVTEQIEKQKMNIVYIMIGLILFAVSGTIVNDLLFRGGTKLVDLTQSTEVLNLAKDTVFQIRYLLNLILSFSGGGAILVLVVAGIRLVINPGDEQQIEKQKSLVGYTAVGIVIIGLADTVVNRIVFPIDPGTGKLLGVNVSLLEIQLQGLSNYILGFLGVIIFVTFVISGVMMVANMGNEDIVSKVKTSMLNVLIGSFVAFSAYTVVATLLRTFLAAEPGAVLGYVMNFV